MLLNMNNKGIVLGFVFLVATCAGMIAQDTNSAKPQVLINLTQLDGQSGRIDIIQPEQAENLLKMHIANNRLKNGEIPGHRIQIFSLSGQTANQKADEICMNFMRNFPDIEAYKKYDAPNWKVFVGNFRTKNEALREKKKIEKIFPGAFIVSATIQISK